MPHEKRQLIALPHISVEDSADLGKWVLISSADLDQFPKKYRPHVRSFGSMYHTLNNNVHDIGVLTRKTGSRFSVLSDGERKQVAQVVDALIFASCYLERMHALARDNFSFTIWTFIGNTKPTDMVNLTSRRFSMNVVKNRAHLIQIPQHVHRQNYTSASSNKELLQAVLRCAYSDRGQDQQIMGSLYWFNLAHADNEDVTEYTRFTMTAAAFEALLDTPRTGVTEYFKKAVQLLLGQNEELETWAGEFYKARSNVVHGNELPNRMYGEHQHHSLLALADLVFTQCVYRLLSLKLYWPPGHAENSLRSDVVKHLVSNKARFVALQHFTLSQERTKTERIRSILYQVQRYDHSVSLDDCNRAFLKVLFLALDGLSRLAKMKDMKETARRELISQYRIVYKNMRHQVKKGRETHVFQSLRTIDDRVGEDIWDDAHVRGKPFGRAKLITLDTLHAALFAIEDLRIEAMYR